ncbi:MAG: phosphotransferase [Syntrophaceae bacterium]|nr:phosphotransferase [Syntrophaceae bacterium]
MEAMNEDVNIDHIKDIARRALNLSEEAAMHVEAVTKGGSSRLYYRIVYNTDNGISLNLENENKTDGNTDISVQKNNDNNLQTVIVMKYNKSVEENNYYVSIAQFLGNIGILAPRILYDEPRQGFIMMEDLGDKDLWSLRNESWDVRRNYYFKTLDMIHTLHSYPVGNFPSENVRLMQSFGKALYRWEHQYFLKHFITGVCHSKIDQSAIQSIGKELNHLTGTLCKQKVCLVHRDFQSQNVMIYKGMPAIIDFQGMRFGSLFYDLGSLLYDPYCVFTNEERTELLNYYYNLTVRKQDWKVFEEMFNLAAIQRLMQALGAYGYLGLKAGKKEFLRYIPNGLNNLLDATGHCKCFPHLERLYRGCLLHI